MLAYADVTILLAGSDSDSDRFRSTPTGWPMKQGVAGVDLFGQHGEMSRLMREFDWAATALGPAAAWPSSLKTVVRIMLDSRFAMWLGWGPEFTFLYNDAYASMTLGAKHPWALGRSAREVWAEIWDDIGPRAQSVVETGVATWDERLLLFLERRGFMEESYHTFSYSPVPNDTGGVGGMLCVVTEDTERVVGERRLRTLRELAAGVTETATSADVACRAAAEILRANHQDLPFALIYLIDEGDRSAKLAGSTRLDLGSPSSIDLSRDADSSPPTWPLRDVLNEGRTRVVSGVNDWLGGLANDPQVETPSSAAVLPIRKSGQDNLAGFFIAGISSRRPFDADYRGFFDVIAGQIGTAVANARAYEEERRRAEALAELDRAKTTFFSNISHEFRTPLSLMLGPIEDMLNQASGQTVPVERDLLGLLQRNGLRLQKLVNTLLDFSRIEAGRLQANYQPTDLAALTVDLASNFRSACEKAGLGLNVVCPSLPEPVFVDRNMWEKIVLNLLSNAFKFTLQGEINVNLAATEQHAELTVRDTGTGIPVDQLPHIFERFHRVEGARGRTAEGSGIGLALVHELVRLQGGTVAVSSQLDQGTTFVVRLPFGMAHLPQEQIRATRTLTPTALAADAYVEEALHWLPSVPHGSEPVGAARLDIPPLSTLELAAGERPVILLADDNADMRGYIQRLLSANYDVIAVADGSDALRIAQHRPVQLVLSDVMMSGLDGFGLLHALRSDPRTRELPVLLLSARAGEEARVEGLQAGADDYMTKPFSAKELLARVQVHLELARVRREARFTVNDSQERLMMALAASDTGTFRWQPSSGKFLEFDDNLKHLFGLASDTRVNGAHDFVACVHADDRDRLAQAFERSRAGADFEEEFRIVRPDGTTRWLYDRAKMERSADGELLYLVGACTDITNRKQAESSLQKSAERLRLLWESATVLLTNEDPDLMLRGLYSKIAAHFSLDFYFNFLVSEAGTHLQLASCTGLSEEQTASIGRLEFGQAICGNVALRRQPIYASYIQVSSEPMVQLVKSYGIRTYACNPLLVDSNLLGTLSFASTRRDSFDPDELEFLRTICHYVTVAYERVRLVRELREQDRSKDEFLATLAHELRNPLAPIRNLLQVLKMPKIDPTLAERSREMMERQVQHLVRLVDDLLDVSRVMRGKVVLRKETVELCTLVSRAIETANSTIAAQQHHLRVALPSEKLWLEADPVRLMQVVGNLLTNAAKYTEPGGTITVAVSVEDDDALVKVRDTGIGIAPEMLAKVFDLFMQVDHASTRSQGGLGIGLTLVRNLVEMHGGTVRARSDGLGKGSEFVVRLPLLPAHRDAPHESYGVHGVQKGRPALQRRLLVIDDHIDAANSLAVLLRLQGHEVAVAHNGPAGLETATNHEPEVIFLDLGMPNMDGFEVARRLREQVHARRPVIVALTGWGAPEDRRRTTEAGFDFHFVKPVEPEAVDQLLASLPSGIGVLPEHVHI